MRTNLLNTFHETACLHVLSTHPDMHVLKEDQESLSNELKIPT